MNRASCRDVLYSVMALRDGEDGVVPRDEAQRHLVSCSECRQAAAEDEQAFSLFKSTTWAKAEPRIWRSLEPRLKPSHKQHGGYLGFLLLGLAVALPRGVVLTLSWPFAWTASLAAGVLIAVYFYIVGENPLKLNPGVAGPSIEEHP